MMIRFAILCVAWSCLLACNNKMESTAVTEAATTTETATPSFTFETKPDQNKVAVRVNGELFTNYLYPDDIAKPILYPLTTVSGKRLTRGFPIDPQPGERTDHPHHVGYWFNYGDVNGLDFWNNSEAIKAEDKDGYGRIHHQEVVDVDEADGQLTVRSNWTAPDGETLIEETTIFQFSQTETTRIIDRSTTLRALVDIDFKDNKEGVVGLRVIKELELPSASQDLVTLVGNDGLPSSQKGSNTAANGDYLSSEGLTGNDVWGKRASWVKLEGEVAGETVSLTLIDHPKNVGYPTYWHARGYGLFAANPLGQAVFSDNKERLNFQLAADESVTFQYRLLIHNGSTLSEEEVDAFRQEFQE